MDGLVVLGADGGRGNPGGNEEGAESMLDEESFRSDVALSRKLIKYIGQSPSS